MNSISNAEKHETEPSKYRVIKHGRLSDPTEKIRDLSYILDHWSVFTENTDDPILDEHIPTARVGSAYTQSSPVLTLRQLFGMWRKGEGIHARFYDEKDETITEPLYMVGMGGSVLSGAYVYWGIVPSQELIVISDRCPESGRCGVRSNSMRYEKAANEVSAGKNTASKY